MNLKEIKFSKKIVFCLVALSIIVSSLLTASWVQSVYVGDLTTFTASGPFSNYSYIVGRYNSTFYYAQNQSSGAYDYLLSNATIVIQNAINQVDSKSIYVMDGTYVIYPSLVITKDNFELTGTWDTIFQASNSLPNDYAGCVIQAQQCEGVNIHDIQVDGNDAGRAIVANGREACISFFSCNNSKIQNTYCHDSPGHLLQSHNARYSEQSFHNKFLFNLLENTGHDWNAVSIGSTTDRAYEDLVMGNTIKNFGCGISFTSGVRCQSVSNELSCNSTVSSHNPLAIVVEGTLPDSCESIDDIVDFTLLPATATGGSAVYFSTGEGHSVTNLHLKGSANMYSGVRFETSHCKMKGGTIDAVARDWECGVYISGDGDYSIVSNVSFEDFGANTTGLATAAGALNCTISLNTFTDVATTITDAGTGTAMHDNRNLSTGVWLAET